MLDSLFVDINAKIYQNDGDSAVVRVTMSGPVVGKRPVIFYEVIKRDLVTYPFPEVIP